MIVIPMYTYSLKDRSLLTERTEQFRDQVTRFLRQELPEDEIHMISNGSLYS